MLNNRQEQGVLKFDYLFWKALPVAEFVQPVVAQSLLSNVTERKTSAESRIYYYLFMKSFGPNN